MAEHCRRADPHHCGTSRSLGTHSWRSGKHVANSWQDYSVSLPSSVKISRPVFARIMSEPIIFISAQTYCTTVARLSLPFVRGRNYEIIYLFGPLLWPVAINFKLVLTGRRFFYSDPSPFSAHRTWKYSIADRYIRANSVIINCLCMSFITAGQTQLSVTVYACVAADVSGDVGAVLSCICVRVNLVPSVYYAVYLTLHEKRRPYL